MGATLAAAQNVTFLAFLHSAYRHRTDRAGMPISTMVMTGRYARSAWLACAGRKKPTASKSR